MTNLEKYKSAFVEVFEIKEDELGDDFTNETCGKWDSVTQMALIAALENAFDIMMDIDDIYELNSYNAGIAVLKKYEVGM